MDPFLLLTYIFGYIIIFRKIAGALAHHTSYNGDIGIEEYVLAFGTASFFSLFWPVIFVGWSMFYLSKKYGPGDGMGILFPEPKPIESKSERQARIASEQKAQIEERQKQINAAERENGLPLTQWDRSY